MVQQVVAERLGEMGISTVQQMFDEKKESVWSYFVGFGAGGGEGAGAGGRVLP